MHALNRSRHRNRIKKSLVIALNNECLVERRITSQSVVRENKKRVGSNISEYSAVFPNTQQ